MNTKPCTGPRALWAISLAFIVSASASAAAPDKAAL